VPDETPPTDTGLGSSTPPAGDGTGATGTAGDTASQDQGVTIPNQATPDSSVGTP
jgi:hypothetical protein